MTGRHAPATLGHLGLVLSATKTATFVALVVFWFGSVNVAPALDEPAPQSLIAYARIVGDTIWMIGAEGGAARQLTTFQSGDPGWSPDGTRVAYTRYQGSTYDGVWIMTAEGTGQRRLTTGFTGGPAWSPAGDRIAYTSPRGIGVVNPDTGNAQQLTVNSDRNPAWSANGRHIMFSRFQRGVWTMNADGARQDQIAIEARHPEWSPGGVRVAYVNHHLEGIHVMDAHGALKRRLTTDGGVFPRWAPDGTRIAYTGRLGDGIWLIDSDGANRRQLATLGRGPAWSPDSTRIAYTRPDGIWIMDADGTELRLTDHGKDPVWSPDGTRILYTSDHQDGIYGIDSDGATPRQIIAGGSEPTWSPNAGRLAFTRPDGIWTMDADGGNPVRLTARYTEGPTWSPNGDRIAYTTRFGGIHLIDANGANQQQLVAGGSHPAWSPDADLLAYVTTEDRSRWTSGPSKAIYLIDAQGANRRILTSDGADPAWSPDGTRIAYTTRTGEIRVGAIDGIGHLSTNRYGSDPTWSPDGQHLVYVGADGGIFAMNTNGGDHRTVTLHRGHHPRWAPDGARIAYQTGRGLAVINTYGGAPLHLADFGETPAWRPSLPGSAPPTPPRPDTHASCPPEHGWHTPRFLPLWTRVASQAPHTVSGPFQITVEFSRPVIGFLAEDIMVANGQVTHFTACNRTFRARISPASVGDVVVRIPPGVARDITRQKNFASAPLVRTGVSQDSATAPEFDPWDRPAVSRQYAEEFGAIAPAMGYTGRVTNCIPGSTAPSFRTEVIGRVNWYRQMAGVGKVTERPAYSELAQQAAMMMAAEGALSHSPGPRWACHTASGFAAAARSNLLLGAVGFEAVDGYMRNQGANNRSAGHRRLLLHPQLSEIGAGDVPGQGGRRSANALYMPQEDLWDSHAEVRQPRGFVAWPPPGYLPAETVWARWSFSRADADFSAASVTVAHDLEPVPVEILTRDWSTAAARGVADPSIVWDVGWETHAASRTTPLGGDLCFSVSVTGVRIEGRIQTPYEYVTCVIPS